MQEVKQWFCLFVFLNLPPQKSFVVFQTLDVLRHYLCTNLEPEKLFPWLQSRKILTSDDCEDIRSLTTTNKKVSKLIDIIKRKVVIYY